MTYSIILKLLTIGLPSIATIFFRNSIDYMGYILLGFALLSASIDIFLYNRKQVKFKNANFWGAIKMLYHSCKFNSEDDVRIMIYKTDGRNKILKPIFPYYPEIKSSFKDETHGSYFNGIPFSKGIVGRAAESKDTCLEIIDNRENLEKILQNYSFNRLEIGQLRKDRMSYLAVPIQYGKKRTKAVVFLDSSSPSTFDSNKIDHIMHVSKHLNSEYL